MKDILKIEASLNGKYDFRYNEVLGRVEYKLKDSNKFSLVDDRKLNTMYVEQARNGFRVTKEGIKNLLESEFSPLFNPFKVYFKQLPAIEGTANFESLCKTLKTHDDAFFKWAFKKWLVAWVACMIDPKITNHQCVILGGQQGIGKSEWLKRLVPKELGEEYNYAGDIKIGNKDTLAYLSSKCLINLDELATMTYKNVTALKELVTKSLIDFRKAYGHFNDSYIRRASFVGSVNGTEFLYDLTGNRRFLSFEVFEFENGGIHDVDMNKVLAEAYQLYKSGFQYWFDKDEQQIVEKNNERFMVLTIEEASLKAKFATKPIKEHDLLLYLDITIIPQREREAYMRYVFRKNEIEKMLGRHAYPAWLRTEEIYTKVMKRDIHNKGELVRFGKLLNKYGFISRRRSNGTYYQVYDIDVRYILRRLEAELEEYEEDIARKNKKKV